MRWSPPGLTIISNMSLGRFNVELYTNSEQEVCKPSLTAVWIPSRSTEYNQSMLCCFQAVALKGIEVVLEDEILKLEKNWISLDNVDFECKAARFSSVVHNLDLKEF
ncbi:hypothetical protein CDAR_414521 [Caerostris darwini]|uniref:Uncharacterized protein n=1 Tax=Caerostris darwini TaxID=1538125 RepID=A0AAV4RH97_9ARAC|nr:hypothetical protein CDAR_414521 [Caerostris darwini]